MPIQLSAAITIESIKNIDFKRVFRFFFRENPAQLHRLIPWLNRELVSLCPTAPLTIPYLLQSIETLLQTHDMTSREFRRRIRAIVPNYTDHFVHELINFARSPFDIIGYDRNVAYNPVFEDDRVITLSSSSSDESDIEFVIDMRSTTNNVDEQRGATATTSAQSTATENAASTSRILRMLSGSEGPLVTPPSVRALFDDATDSDEEEITNYLHTNSTVSNEEIIRGRTDAAAAAIAAAVNDNNNQSSRTSDQTVIVSTNNTNNSNSPATIAVPSPAAVAVVVAHTSTSNPMETNAVIANVADDSASDSDECQFVCAKKPPHLRTPEFVELNSESDSDVVFVDEMQLTGQAIKVEKNGRSKASSIIVSTAGPSSVSSTNVIVSSGRRKRRHHNDEANAVGANRNQMDEIAENLTSAVFATICETSIASAVAAAATATPPNTTIEMKPSTSSQWKVSLDAQASSVDLYQSANRPNAIVFNRNSHPRALAFMARKSAGGGKRIYEASSSSDDEKSTDAELSSTSSTSNSSSDSDDIQSSSHEEYVVSASPRKRKSTTEVTPRATRKRYRKKVNVKQIAARKKKNSKSSIKPQRAPKKRTKRIKMTPDTTSSSSDEEHSNRSQIS